jgi:hypothetical protein
LKTAFFVAIAVFLICIYSCNTDFHSYGRASVQAPALTANQIAQIAYQNEPHAAPVEGSARLITGTGGPQTAGMQQIYQQVVDQQLAQYYLVAGTLVGQYPLESTSIDLCVHAGMVAAAYLQAGDAANYTGWKQVSRGPYCLDGVKFGLGKAKPVKEDTGDYEIVDGKIKPLNHHYRWVVYDVIVRLDSKH